MSNSTTKPLQAGTHYYFDSESGLLVFTAQYHLLRGYCCKSGCRHCPYRVDRGQSTSQKYAADQPGK